MSNPTNANTCDLCGDQPHVMHLHQLCHFTAPLLATAETYQWIRSPRDGQVVGVLRGSDKANIPADPKNRDWNEYLNWAKKNRPTEPAATPVPSPTPTPQPDNQEN